MYRVALVVSKFQSGCTISASQLISSRKPRFSGVILLRPSNRSQTRLAEVAADHSAANQGFARLQIGKIGEPPIELFADPSVDSRSFILALEGANLRQKLAKIVTRATHYLIRKGILFR